MLTEDLFNTILVKPAEATDVRKLRIVSGFASGSMAKSHMEVLARMDRPIGIELIIGMTSRHGVSKADHLLFRNLVHDPPHGGEFLCRYHCGDVPIHAKIYNWISENGPRTAFLGSANYTLTGFGSGQLEAMSTVEVAHACSFFERVIQGTIDCCEDDVETKIAIVDRKSEDSILETSGRSYETDENPDLNLESLLYVDLPLLARDGQTHRQGGINWGQRVGRNPDEAYIPIPRAVQSRDFFPKRKMHFNVKTDDGESFTMVVAQDEGKALETPESNAIIGAYLRRRMRLPSGIYVTRQHLENYGRLDIRFYKIDQENFYLDFSV